MINFKTFFIYFDIFIYLDKFGLVKELMIDKIFKICLFTASFTEFLKLNLISLDTFRSRYPNSNYCLQEEQNFKINFKDFA